MSYKCGLEQRLSSAAEAALYITLYNLYGPCSYNAQSFYGVLAKQWTSCHSRDRSVDMWTESIGFRKHVNVDCRHLKMRLEDDNETTHMLRSYRRGTPLLSVVRVSHCDTRRVKVPRIDDYHQIYHRGLAHNSVLYNISSTVHGRAGKAAFMESDSPSYGYCSFSRLIFEHISCWKLDIGSSI